MAGRPKRRARIAAQWAEVDRAAGVKVPRSKRKKNGGLPAGWRLYGGGPFKRRFFYGEYTLVCLRPERGRHLYATFSGGDNPSEWAWLADYRLASEVADGSLGVEVDFDKAPTAIQTAIAEVLATVGLVSVPANRRTPNAGRPKREVRVAGLTWDEWQESLARQYRTAPGQPYRKRNGGRYRLFESKGRRLHGRDLLLVDTEAHEGYYQILWLGVHDSGHNDVNYTEVQAFGNAFDPRDYTLGRELPLDAVPARFHSIVDQHMELGAIDRG